MNKNSTIYIAGHRGLVGSAVVRELTKKGYTNLILKTHAELDLINQADVNNFFKETEPDYVILSAAKVGGIGANSKYPGDFIYQNLAIATNIIEASRQNGVEKLINLGSSCIYPKLAPQPLKEEYLLSGKLEPTNDAYAIAKIAAIKMCSAYNKQYGTNFLSVMPTNLYGPGDTYDINNGHVLPVLIRKFHEAKISGKDVVGLWGDGSPLREFLYSDDLAEAIVFLLEGYSAKDLPEFANIGTGIDISIKELAETIQEIVYADVSGRTCQIEWDTEKPNGTPRKVLDVSYMTGLGWKAKIKLVDGLKMAYQDFLKLDMHTGE